MKSFKEMHFTDDYFKNSIITNHIIFKAIHADQFANTGYAFIEISLNTVKSFLFIK